MPYPCHVVSRATTMMVVMMMMMLVVMMATIRKIVIPYYHSILSYVIMEGLEHTAVVSLSPSMVCVLFEYPFVIRHHGGTGAYCCSLTLSIYGLCTSIYVLRMYYHLEWLISTKPETLRYSVIICIRYYSMYFVTFYRFLVYLSHRESLLVTLAPVGDEVESSPTQPGDGSTSSPPPHPAYPPA